MVARIRRELIHVGKKLLNNGRETFMFWFYSNYNATGLDTKGRTKLCAIWSMIGLSYYQKQ